MSDEPSPLEWSDESEVQMYADGGRKLKWSPSTYTFQTRQTVKHPHPPPPTMLVLRLVASLLVGTLATASSLTIQSGRISVLSVDGQQLRSESYV